MSLNKLNLHLSSMNRVTLVPWWRQEMYLLIKPNLPWCYQMLRGVFCHLLKRFPRRYLSTATTACELLWFLHMSRKRMLVPILPEGSSTRETDESICLTWNINNRHFKIFKKISKCYRKSTFCAKMAGQLPWKSS